MSGEILQLLTVCPKPGHRVSSHKFVLLLLGLILFLCKADENLLEGGLRDRIFHNTNSWRSFHALMPLRKPRNGNETGCSSILSKTYFQGWKCIIGVTETIFQSHMAVGKQASLNFSEHLKTLIFMISGMIGSYGKYLSKLSVFCPSSQQKRLLLVPRSCTTVFSEKYLWGDRELNIGIIWHW